MKSIILVAAHTPTKEKQDVLRKLIRRLNELNQDIFLITHSHTPSDIIDDVKYFLYDSENEHIKGDEYTGWYRTTFFDNVLVSKDVIKQSTSILPCTRNLYFGLLNCKMLGYDIAHYLEYDCEIFTTQLIDENNKLLKKYDGVFYKTKRGFGGDDYHLYGAYSVYNLNSYTYDELIWNRDNILESFKNVNNNTLVEKVTESLLIKHKNFISFNKSEIDETSIKLDVIKSYSDSPIDPKILFVDDNKLHIYCCNKNVDKVNEYVEVIVNNNIIINLPLLEPDIFHFRTIGLIKDITNVKLYSNNKFIFEYDLTIEGNVDKLHKNNYLLK